MPIDSITVVVIAIILIVVAHLIGIIVGALIMCIPIWFLWRSSKHLLIQIGQYEEDYSNLEASYNEAVGVVSGRLMQYMEQLVKADASIIYTNEVSKLYRYIVEAHKKIYDIMSQHSIQVNGKALPPYQGPAKLMLEETYLNAKDTIQQQADRDFGRDPDHIVKPIGISPVFRR